MSHTQNHTIINENYANLLPYPTFITNESGRVIKWGQQASVIFGFSDEEMLHDENKTLLNHITTETWQQALEGKFAIETKTITFTTKSAQEISAKVILQPCLYQQQNAMLCILVTDEAPADYIATLKALVDIKQCLDDKLMLVEFDEDGFIITANATFLKASDWTPKRILGKSFWQLFPDSNAQNKVPKQLWRTLQQGQYWQGEVQMLSKNNTIYWAHLTALPTYCPITKLQRFILIGKDITRLKTEQEKLEKYAYIDADTGLMNAYWLEKELDRLVQENQTFSFVYLSIDKYYTMKELQNPDLDEGLAITFTKRLQSYFQDSIITRITENDFALLTPLSEWYIQGFLHYLQSEPIYHDNIAMPISISGGITRFPPEFSTFTQLMKASTATVGEVRAAGGNKIATLSPDRHRKMNRQSLIEKRLLLALDQKDLQVLYQPQVDLETGKVAAVEAFVRWQDEIVGVVPPNELIPIAEETGLIHGIGSYMIQEACEQAVKWQNAGTPLKISINVSVREFRDKNMVELVLDILQKTGCPASLIQFEITEKFALEAELATTITKQMQVLSSKGITFILDDFGTGYASFRYMQMLPISVFKIDRSFINSMLESVKTQTLVNSMVQLGKSLGLTVIAEGVETETQKNWLHDFGCNGIQGYLVSKPLIPEEVVNFLASQN